MQLRFNLVLRSVRLCMAVWYIRMSRIGRTGRWELGRIVVGKDEQKVLSSLRYNIRLLTGSKIFKIMFTSNGHDDTVNAKFNGTVPTKTGFTTTLPLEIIYIRCWFHWTGTNWFRFRSGSSSFRFRLASKRWRVRTPGAARKFASLVSTVSKTFKPSHLSCLCALIRERGEGNTSEVSEPLLDFEPNCDREMGFFRVSTKHLNNIKAD